MISESAIKAAMQYSFALTPETFTVAGYTVEIWQDSDTENPYDNCDGMAPALWLSYDLKEYGRADLTDPLRRFTPAQVSRHWRAIAAALDLSESEHDAEAREHAVNYRQSLSESRRDLFNDAMSDMRDSDRLEALRALFHLLGYPAETFTRTGYSQGDVIRGLIVWTPEWVAQVGADPARAAKDMESEANTYGAWVWGDCYGYTVTRDGEDIGQCGGFIGNTDSGLIEYLLSDIESDRRARRRKIKDMIRARAPLEARAAYLAGAMTGT